MTIELGVLIGLAGTIAGILFGYTGQQRAAKKDVRDDTKDHTELKTNLEYIRRGVDDIRIDLKAQESKVSDLAGAVIRVEEIAKSAHKRIDGIEERKWSNE